MPEPFLGQIVTITRHRVGHGWVACDGTLLNIQQNHALFSILGTTYGGDGVQTFALPDLRDYPTSLEEILAVPGLGEYAVSERAPAHPYLALEFMIATQAASPACSASPRQV